MRGVHPQEPCSSGVGTYPRPVPPAGLGFFALHGTKKALPEFGREVPPALGTAVSVNMDKPGDLRLLELRLNLPVTGI
jgi:hypothetical protein